MENEDGRWEDQEWIERQAELSGCEDSYEQGIIYV
jgi:hypothetical protein